MDVVDGENGARGQPIPGQRTHRATDCGEHDTSTLATTIAGNLAAAAIKCRMRTTGFWSGLAGHPYPTSSSGGRVIPLTGSRYRTSGSSSGPPAAWTRLR